MYKSVRSRTLRVVSSCTTVNTILIGALWVLLLSTRLNCVTHKAPDYVQQQKPTLTNVYQESSTGLTSRLEPGDSRITDLAVYDGVLAEIWSLGPAQAPAGTGHGKYDSSAVVARLLPDQRHQLGELCGRCIYHTLTHFVKAGPLAGRVFVATGDIPDQWIRDSSVQLGIYLPRLRTHPLLRPIVEGAIRTQAFYILADPWANSFRSTWTAPSSLDKWERQIGRGGWVATRNFEADSGAYFLHLLWNYHAAARRQRLYDPAALLASPLVHDAAALMVRTWLIETQHEELSPYRYAELAREGRGAITGYTGLVWSGFRASDDPQKYGYNVPDNIYIAGALQRLLLLNKIYWRDEELQHNATQLLHGIEDGIRRHAVVEVEAGVHVYAYEIDGLGNKLVDFDDANMPSLLGMPLLGWSGYNARTYEATRTRLLSARNPWYFEGAQLRGIGSPHTGERRVWPLALVVQALTSSDVAEQAALLAKLLDLQCGNGLMHESVHVDRLSDCTRPEFEWANAMAVAGVEALLGVNCDAVYEAQLAAAIAEREAREAKVPQAGGPDIAAYYERLESLLPFMA